MLSTEMATGRLISGQLEVLGDSVPPDEAEREFLKRVRAL